MKDDDWLIMRVMRLPHERGTATGTRKPIADQGQSRMQAWIAGLTVLGYETYYPALRELRRVPRRELSPSQRNGGSTGCASASAQAAAQSQARPRWSTFLHPATRYASLARRLSTEKELLPRGRNVL
jgi:hypothetical protein